MVERAGWADGGQSSPGRRWKDGGWDHRPGHRIARPKTYPPGHGLMPAAAPGSLQGLAGGEGAARGSGPRWPAVPTPGGGAGGWVPGPPTPTAVSGRRRAERRLRAWTPSLLPPRGSQLGAPASEGRGEKAGEGRPRPPPRGPQSLPRVLGGWNQPEIHRPRGGGEGGARGPGPGGGRRAAAPRAVRGPGGGGPEGCWRLRLSPSPPLPVSPSLCGHIRKFHSGDA